MHFHLQFWASSSLFQCVSHFEVRSSSCAFCAPCFVLCFAFHVFRRGQRRRAGHVLSGCLREWFRQQLAGSPYTQIPCTMVMQFVCP